MEVKHIVGEVTGQTELQCSDKDGQKNPTGSVSDMEEGKEWKQLK